MKKVLVTGASGFIGQHCLNLLANRGFQVHAVRHEHSTWNLPNVVWHQADLLSQLQTRELISEVHPSHLLHLAWYTEPASYRQSPRNLDWVGASLALLKSFAQHDGKRAVIAGSCAEYDWTNGWCSEDTTPLVPQGLYGACKHALQVISSAYAETIGLSLAWGRVFFLYGPGESPQRLVPSVIRSLLRGEMATCQHGRSSRDYIHVQDAAASFAALVDCDLQGPINIATGRAVLLGDLVRMIGQILDRNELLNIVEQSAKPERLVADVTRLHKNVGFSNSFDLRGGMEQTITRWKQQQELSR